MIESGTYGLTCKGECSHDALKIMDVRGQLGGAVCVTRVAFDG